MMKGIYISGLPENYSYQEKFKLAEKAGFDGVQVPTIESQQELEEIKRILEKTGLKIPSIMNANHWQYPFSSRDSLDIEKALAGMRRSLECAEFLGADTVLLVPAVVKEDLSYEEAMKNSRANIKVIIPEFEAKGICIGIENVWNKFLLSPIEFRDYVDSFKTETIRAYFDVGNILLYGYPQDWIRTLGKRIKRIHLKDFKLASKSFVYLWEGDVNWKEVMEALHKVGYDDYLTAELPSDKAKPEERVYQISKDMDKIIESLTYGKI